MCSIAALWTGLSHWAARMLPFGNWRWLVRPACRPSRVPASGLVGLLAGVGASTAGDMFEKAPWPAFINERSMPWGGGRERSWSWRCHGIGSYEPDRMFSIQLLLRPGRFDRQVAADRPGDAGRV
ncbi:hypothetical protein NL676_027467 [Syzygium grande]|nr:hypothetical protein NL676_027467 [Syzygium grande]